jgi:hypothetical protein
LLKLKFCQPSMKTRIVSKLYRLSLWGIVGLICGGVALAQSLSPGVMDIGKLANAHVPEETIINYVKGSGISYHLTTDDIIYLNGQGVTPNVMTLLQSSGPAPEPAAQTPPPTPAPPPENASAAPSPDINLAYFQGQLGPYGTWTDLPPYGPVWRPGIAVNDPTWRPYCQGGHWVMTDAGWYWQADDPWGATVFHYGRWLFDANNGWIWVPGFNWAPSWVAWRRTDGFYGWAPLPPQADFVAGVGISIGGVAVAANFDFGLGAAAFCFVGFDHLWAHDYGVVMLPSARVDIVFRTSVIQNSYHVVGGRFVAEGFGREDIAIRTGHPVEVVSINKQVVVEHTTVVKNITNVRNVSIRNNVTTVRNVTNVKNVSNTRNVNNVNNTRNVSNTRDVNNRENPAGARSPQAAPQRPAAEATRPGTAATHPGTEPARPGAPGAYGTQHPAPGSAAKPAAAKKPGPPKENEGQPQKQPQ